MSRRSAGLLLFRRAPGGLEVLLVHPGGPFFARRDLGVWSIPKGEVEPGEELLVAARRELTEETGFSADGDAIPLGEVRQASKTVHAFAVEGNADPRALQSNLCEIEWPSKSGRRLTIPEVDRAAWFSLDEARERLVAAQAELLSRLVQALAAEPPGAAR